MHDRISIGLSGSRCMARRNGSASCTTKAHLPSSCCSSLSEALRAHVIPAPSQKIYCRSWRCSQTRLYFDLLGFSGLGIVPWHQHIGAPRTGQRDRMRNIIPCITRRIDLDRVPRSEKGSIEEARWLVEIMAISAMQTASSLTRPGALESLPRLAAFGCRICR